MTRHGCQQDLTQFLQNSVDPVHGNLVTHVPEFHLYRGIHDNTPGEFSSGPSANFGVDAKIRDVMHAQVGDPPQRHDVQIQSRCYPYCLDLVRLFHSGTEDGSEKSPLPAG
jgi:hypothetical protein